MGSAGRFCKLTRDAFCIPLTVLQGSNKMTKWIAKLFQTKPNSADIVRFIRTEYTNDTKHLADDDVIEYYNNITKIRRRT
jgi:hypothetical protein